MRIAKTISTRVVNTFRLIKALVTGNNDVREVNEATPFGIDSNPVAGMAAYYTNTTTNGAGVIIGYANNNQLAQVGETRIFATSTAGVFQFNVWVRGSDVLIGDSSTPSAYIETLMKYTAFNTAMQAYLLSLNIAITSGVASAGGAYTPPTAPDFSTASATKIKTT